MTCYAPRNAYYSAQVNENGKRDIVFDSSKSFLNYSFQIPCGYCCGCRLDYSRSWAVRLSNELRMHKHAYFLTLTYDDDNLPKNLSLDKTHHQLFLKRLRKKFKQRNIRYFHCGEYGERTKRPHYHTILFGLELTDLVYYKKTERGDKLYNSKTFDKLWKLGRVIIGDVTFDSCAYVARYTMKKWKGDKEKVLKHYDGRLPEYATMSRRPGIGTEYVKKYHNDIFNNKFLISRGHKVGVPRAYENHLEKIDKDRFLEYKKEKLSTEFDEYENSHERLSVREQIKKYKLEMLDKYRSR